MAQDYTQEKRHFAYNRTVMSNNQYSVIRKHSKVLSYKIRTYQILFFLIAIVLSNYSFAQKIKKVYQPSEIFESSSLNKLPYISVKESFGKEVKRIDQFYIEAPYNPITKESNYYLMHRKYQFDNGQIISLDIISDSIFLFREYIKTFDLKEDSIISSGRLEFSKQNIRTNEIELLDSYGEDSLVIDTLYTLVPNGFWSMNIDSNLFEIGKYVDGKREGEWQTIIARFSLRRRPPIIRITEYKTDRIVNITQIDKSKDLGFLKENIMGKWYYEGMDLQYGIRSSNKNRYNDFYVKNKKEAYYGSRFRGAYNHFSLLKKGIMEYIVGTACGTGISLETSKWNLSKNGQLILDGKKWNIEYFTEDRLIISRYIGS